MSRELRTDWKPVHYEAESPYTRSGRVLNPAPGGWCPTRDREVNGRYRPYRTEEACQLACDRLNHRFPAARKP